MSKLRTISQLGIPFQPFHSYVVQLSVTQIIAMHPHILGSFTRYVFNLFCGMKIFIFVMTWVLYLQSSSVRTNIDSCIQCLCIALSTAVLYFILGFSVSVFPAGIQKNHLRPSAFVHYHLVPRIMWNVSSHLSINVSGAAIRLRIFVFSWMHEWRLISQVWTLYEKNQNSKEQSV